MGIFAFLLGLRRVDAFQPDSLAVYFQGVAVDDSGTSGYYLIG